jgi:hypothetical protein
MVAVYAERPGEERPEGRLDERTTPRCMPGIGWACIPWSVLVAN